MTTCKVAHSFFLPCDPIPAPRPRATARGRFASVYHPPEYTRWKEGVAEAVRGVNDRPPEPLSVPLVVTVEVFVERPKTTKLTHPGPDIDNYAKGVLDAITQSGLIWADDKHVVDLRISKAWCDDTNPCPGFAVTVTPKVTGWAWVWKLLTR